VAVNLGFHGDSADYKLHIHLYNKVWGNPLSTYHFFGKKVVVFSVLSLEKRQA
jgi:hypothetical protein